ncbi:hypothetical protein AC629_36410 [Bradyrhizobium sp. NAS80.1]|uniref:hypothetical protein n=1 Tax=Bradyrhizobium sp. NAS80.1 TaxID=1680159 RepID=UPI0009628A08|nr:hypothetical protein [Bradyrhizobium sp. NAS80.1]OKO73749.1 hypothetical protein AC629_36410 [Bradyrhizobium sp. NAS80.1]
MPKRSHEQRRLDLIFGARALARYIFDDEEKWKAVYRLKHELGLFKMRGLICGRPATIDQRIAAREAAMEETA